MNKIVNIAIIGLGQVGIYLYNELRLKKKEIEIKTGKKINIVAISAKNKNKKRKYNINKKIFYTNPFQILKEKKIDILFESIERVAKKNRLQIIFDKSSEPVLLYTNPIHDYTDYVLEDLGLTEKNI